MRNKAARWDDTQTPRARSSLNTSDQPLDLESLQNKHVSLFGSEEFVNKINEDLPHHKFDPIFNRAACRDLSTAAAVVAILHLTRNSSESVELLISTFRNSEVVVVCKPIITKAIVKWENHPEKYLKPQRRASLIIQRLFRQPTPKRFTRTGEWLSFFSSWSLSLMRCSWQSHTGGATGSAYSR